MNINEVKGKFRELKGDFKKKWGELTDEDWKVIGGNKDKLKGILQQNTGARKKRPNARLMNSPRKIRSERSPEAYNGKP